MTDGDARRVADALCRMARGRYGASVRLEGEGALVRRPWSVHIHPRVSVPGGRVELIVKIPLWDEAPDLRSALAAGPQADTRAEFDALVEIAEMVERSGDGGLAAIRPVAYLEEINAVVTERLVSRPLGALSPREQCTAAPALGRWLRRYHDEIGGATEARFDPPGTIERLHRAVAGLDRAALGAAVASLEEAAAGLGGAPVRVAVTHGDLGPSNVLVTPSGRVAVIDPNRVPGPAVDDLAKPMVALRIRRLRLLSGIPPRREDRFGSGLLDGYGAVDPRMLALAAGTAVAMRWADVERAARGWRRAALPPALRLLGAEVRRAVAVAAGR